MADGTVQAQNPNNGNKSGGDSVDLPPAKRGRGRPPGSTSKSAEAKGAVIIPIKKEQPKAVVKTSPTPDQMESAKFLGDGVVSVVEMVESAVHHKCEIRVAQKRPAKLPDFRRLLAEQALQPAEKTLVSSCVSRIALRHDWMTRYAPEVVLGIVLAKYAARQVSLLRFVENLTKEEPQKTVQPEPPKSAQRVNPDQEPPPLPNNTVS